MIMERRIYEAAVEGSVTSLLELLQEDRLILDRVIINCLTETPLHVAAMLGHIDFVKEILNRKPELAAELDSRRFSPLHLASAKGYVDIVKELLQINPDMCFATDQDGRNPLHLAAMKGRVDVLRELVRARPQAARVTVDRGETILHVCVKYNQLECLKLLLVESMDVHGFVNARDDDGIAILHAAVANKQFETINFLLVNTRVEVNAVNATGVTALDILSQSRRHIKDMDIGESLRNAGALRACDIPNSTRRNIGPRGMSFQTIYMPQPSQTYNILPENFNQEDWLTRKRDALMVVASLMATMAFQAGISPPGGVWQDDLSTADSQGNGNGSIPHVAGASVMAYKKPDDYHLFLSYNTTGFIAALSVILLLITGLPFKQRFLLWVLTVIMWVAITAMALTYGISIVIFTPKQEQEIVNNVISFAVTVWCGVMAVVLVANTIRLIAISTGKFGRFRWGERRTSHLVYLNRDNLSS